MTDDLVARRLTSQGLSGPPAGTVDAVVERLLAVQAQDARGVRLAVRSRSAGLSSADVDAALDDGRLVVGWLNRGTLHLVQAADYWWLHALTTPQLATGNARRLRQEGVDPEQARRGVEVVAASVDAGPRTRAELRADLDAAGVPTRGQALVHVLFAAGLRGLVVRGPMRGGEQAWVDAHRWLGPPSDVGRDEALARLALRYLAGHAPAGARDLARWAGTTLGDARRALGAVADRTEPWGPDLVVPASYGDPAPLPPPRLLGAFDPLLLGWENRDPVVGPHREVVTTNGVFRPTALVRGRVVATWGLAGGVVTTTPLEPLTRGVTAALEREAAAVLRFLRPPGAGGG